MANLFNLLNPSKKLVSLSFQDEDGAWIDISELIPLFELEPTPQTQEESKIED